MPLIAMAAMASSAAVGSLEGGPDADIGHELLATVVLFLFLCTIFLVLRLWTHCAAGSALFPGDWLMLSSYTLMMGLCIDLIIST